MTAPSLVGTDCDTVEVVFFSLAGWRVGLEACWVRGAYAALSTDWDAQQGGGTAALLGFPVSYQTPTSPQWLALHSLAQPDQAAHCILVEGPVDLVLLPVAAIHPVPQLLAVSTQLHGLQALVLQGYPMAPTGVSFLFAAAVLWPHVK